MTAGQAKLVEYGIIALCIIALLMIFQPFTQFFYSIGAGLVVLGGLAFNLIPFCREGVPFSKLGKIALIVLTILGVAVLLGIGTGYLYVWYLGLSKA
ncbi:MAG: hypothetical protein OEU92_22555 [Alphaproteobacteria bacterium]|nr:hypothetical protein [Alphaproteobacteria bacterium]